jgi:hypothetical protein
MIERITRRLDDGSYVVNDEAFIETNIFATFLESMLRLAKEIPKEYHDKATISTAEDYYDGSRVGWIRPATPEEIEAYEREWAAVGAAREARVREELEQAVKDWRPFVRG